MQGFARGLRGGEVRFETVVAKAQGEQIRGAAKGGVGSTSVGGGGEHGAFRGSLRKDLFKLAGLESAECRRE